MTLVRFQVGALLLCWVSLIGGAGPPAVQAQGSPPPPQTFAQFDGIGSYIEVPSSQDLSVATTGALTVSAWMRPDTLTFPETEGSGYVYWLGKGSAGQQEWVFRMYSQGNQENRANRISFYVFNPNGGLGIGSYVEQPVLPGEWLQLVGIADHGRISISRNGVFARCDQYAGAGDGTCQTYAPSLWITPQAGTAPLRMGTRDLHSYFQGALAEVRVWNRALSQDEVAALYAQDQAPREGLVAEYLLNEGTGRVAHDTAGGRAGTLSGVSWGGGAPAPPPPSSGD